MWRRMLLSGAVSAILITFGCERPPSGPSKTLKINGLTATLTGEFRTAGSAVAIEFKDAKGEPVDVGKVTLTLAMNMPGMPMHTSAEVNGSGGNYTAKLKPEMMGTWMGALRYEGPQGTGQTTFEVNVQ